MPSVILAERDPVFRLLACVLEPARRAGEQAWAEEYLWPVSDFATEAEAICARAGIQPLRTAFLDEGFDADAELIVTETVVIDDDVRRLLPNLRTMIAYGSSQAAELAVDCHGVEVIGFDRRTTTSVAEHALALALAVLRDVPAVDREVRRAPPRRTPGTYAYNWLDAEPATLAGRDCALLGFGEIGQAIARRLEPFGARLHYWARRRRPAADAGVQFVPELMEILALADVVFVSLPSTPETHGLLGRRELAAIGPDGILINVARGAIVDEGDLVTALASRALKAAGLDVFEQEPLEASNPLREMEQVVLSPHCAGGSRRALLTELCELAGLAAGRIGEHAAI